MAVIQVEPALLFDSNMYVIIGSQRTALIDTGTGFAADATVKSISSVLGERKLDVIILTHRHYDHVGGLRRIIKEFSPSQIYAGPADAEPLRKGDSESTLGTKFGGSIDPTDVIDYSDGDVIDLGDHRLRCIETPGHTIGSISIMDEQTGALFSGDTVFIDGVGNTIHPTGSDRMLIGSLKKLATLDINGLYPGHGPTVTKGGIEFIKKGMKMMGVIE